MSSKQFVTSTQPRQSRQFPKLQLSQHRYTNPHIIKTQQQIDDGKRLDQEKFQRLIYDKITEVEKENEKLLKIANQLNRSSLSFTVNEQLSSLIYPIQEQMKSAFNQLIESIQEFYIDIDTKIKEIGSYLATLSGVETHETSKKDHDDFIFPLNAENIIQPSKQKPYFLTQEQQTIRSINMKIQLMQKDLELTKSNQTKLMSFIEKLVDKYQLNHQTTIVKDDPFLQNKVQGIVSSRVQGKFPYKAHHSPRNVKQKNYDQSKQRFIEGHTFSKPNYLHNQLLPDEINSTGAPINPFNQVKPSENPQRDVPNIQNFNDYSIYQELNTIQENHHTLQNQRSFGTNSFSQPKDLFGKDKQKSKFVPHKMQASTFSVNSYAYQNSNSIVEQDDDHCFIKKLYSKQGPSLTKVSLKNCTNPNKTVFQLKRPQEQTPVQQSNKNHRQAYLLNQLKRIG